MTSRERIIAALNHRESDRIPVDLGATESSGITWKAYNRLKKYLGFESETYVFDLMQLIAKVDPEIAGIAGSDAIPLLFEPLQWKRWEFCDGEAVNVPAKANLKKLTDGSTVLVEQDTQSSKETILSRLPAKGFYFDTVYNPLERLDSGDDLSGFRRVFDTFDLPEYFDEGFNKLSEKARKLHSETDFAVVGNLWVHILAAGQAHRGFENFMVDLVSDKKLAHKILSSQLESYLERIDRYAQAVGSFIDVVQVNDDLGTQNGLQLSVELYREMLKPYHRKLWAYVKEKCKKPLLLHSCGSIYDLIPDLIDCGIDALNPVQVSAKKMDTKVLKREFGKYITFWGGGCDTQKILPYGTAEQVEEEVRKRSEDLSGGGGFIFCQVHNIQPDVPAENIIAMYRQIGSLNLA